ncbi:MAG TPA: hypothetical protein VGK36_08765 [Candidatus Angelobacter sp.]|jgi:hypothetical protein
MAERTFVKTKVEQQGKFANVCGRLWLVELKASRNDSSKEFHVLTMEDGVEIISWHTSPESREQYMRAEGHTVTVQVKAAHARGRNFLYLQSLRVTCACEKCKPVADSSAHSGLTVL